MIYDFMPMLDGIESVTELYYPFYVITAARKIMFYLDHRRTGKIKIKDLLLSPILAELQEIQKGNLNDEKGKMYNWFSFNHSLKVYEKYLALDKDHNGMLSRQELSR